MEKNPPLIGCEVELQLLPQQREEFLRGYPELWEFLASAMGGQWNVQRDAGTNVATGMSSGEGLEKTCISNDSAKTLLELALPPATSIERLHETWLLHFAPIAAALRSKAIHILGVGMHPEIDIGMNGAYETWVTPRGRYGLVKERGWQHHWLLTPASTQPSIDIPLDQPTEYVNLLERALPLLQPLCANSNVRRWEADEQYAELRNTVCYSRVFERSIDASFMVAGMPEKPYEHTGDYLRYLFSIPNYFVVSNKGSADYKSSGLITLQPDATGKPPSLEVLLTTLIEQHGRWEGRTLEGGSVSLGIEDISPGQVGHVDWYSFRPARMKYILRDYASWEEFWHDYRTAPERVLRKAFIEVRSISTQLPGEEMLPCALVTGIVRGKDEMQRYLDTLCDWSEMLAFHRTLADQYVAWDSIIGNRRYPDVARDLVEIVSQQLSPTERRFIEPLTERMKNNESPAHLARREIRRSRDAFLSLVGYQSE